MLDKLQLIKDKVLHLVEELNVLRHRSDELRSENKLLSTNSEDDTDKLERILGLLESVSNDNNTVFEQDKGETEQ